MESTVKIGPQYFTKELREYSNWRRAFARESCQNGIDAAGSTQLDVIINEQNGNTVVVFANNGEPMTEEVLLNKFLALGESGKEFNGTAGGFGKAKTLLAFSHEGYTIRTGSLEVNGRGGNFSLTRDLPYHHGTSTTVTIKGEKADEMEAAYARFAELCQWKGTMTINGKVHETALRKGHHRRDLSWCRIYTNQQYSGLLVVRIGGQPMFTKNVAWKGCVIVELNGQSGDRLTSNRDSLLYKYSDELDEFVTDLTVDTRSALRNRVADYKRYEGEKLRAEKAKPKAQEGFNVAAFVAQVSQPQAAPTLSGTTRPNYGGLNTTVGTRAVSRTASIGPDFVIKNTVGIDTPKYYVPGDDFSAYSKGLVKAWALSLKKLYELAGIEGEFSIGFVLDDDNLAEAEDSPEYGKVYYLSPASVVKNTRFNSRSFKARYTSAWTSRFEILALVAHEFTHGAYDLSSHNEDYAAKLTETMGLIFANMKEFTPFYR